MLTANSVNRDLVFEHPHEIPYCSPLYEVLTKWRYLDSVETAQNWQSAVYLLLKYGADPDQPSYDFETENFIEPRKACEYFLNLVVSIVPSDSGNEAEEKLFYQILLILKDTFTTVRDYQTALTNKI